MDASVAQADISFVDAGPVHDQRIGDHRIHRPARACDLALAHPIADHLATAELDFLAIDGRIRPATAAHGAPDGKCRKVAFNLDDQVRIGQSQAVACRGAIHRGIVCAGNFDGHRNDPSMNAAKSECQSGPMTA